MSPTPEEPPDGGSEEDDAGTRGWIDPDDRLWRHPSEVAAGSAPAAPVPTRSRRRTPIMIAVGAVAALAAAAGTFVLIAPGATRPPTAAGRTAADVPLTTMVSGSGTIPAAADAAGRAMVLLRADTTHGTVDLVGVAVAEGGMVATAGAGLSGLRRLAMVGPGGHLRPATLVGADPQSDIALVSVPDDLPVAPFSDDVSLNDGSADMTLTVVAASSAAPALHSLPGWVTGIGGAIAGGPATGMPGITSSAVGDPEAAGDLLLDPAGSVLGIYYGGRAGPAMEGPTFLPTELVLGVADDLRSSGHVTHGWLGIRGTDAGQGGAAVAQVASGSPAAGHLAAGDVIAELNSVPIRSMADLRGRLYVLPPSTHVALSVREGGSVDVVDVTLSASP